MIKIRSKCISAMLLGSFFCALILGGRAQAYVMPTEQILYLMGTRFSGFKTLVITQKTSLASLHDPEMEVIQKEKIWLKAPDLYRSELIGEPESQDVENVSTANRGPGGDMAFRRLMMANNLESMVSLLSKLGIDIESVSLTRSDGVIAYRLGSEDPESPKLVIEKDTLLPISFCYTSQVGPDWKIVTVHFGDYQKTGNGWYPHEITYSADKEVLERYVILDLQVNTPVEQPLTEISIERSIPSRGLDVSQDVYEKEERLREIIELFKEKYE